MAIEHADFDGGECLVAYWLSRCLPGIAVPFILIICAIPAVERLALVLGGEIVSTFDTPDKVKLGTCKLIEEVMIGEDKLLKFSGVELGSACTIVLRGATDQILQEADRSLHDALCVLSQTINETRVFYGGGCAEMLMANAVCEEAAKTPGKEAEAMEAFARALRQVGQPPAYFPNPAAGRRLLTHLPSFFLAPAAHHYCRQCRP